jgi:hypothetical protein
MLTAAAAGVEVIDTGLAECGALVIGMLRGMVCPGTDVAALAGRFCAGTGGRKTAVCCDDDTLSARETAGEKNKIASATASEVRNSLRTLSVIATIMPATSLPHVYFEKGWRLGQLPIAFWS